MATKNDPAPSAQLIVMQPRFFGASQPFIGLILGYPPDERITQVEKDRVMAKIPLGFCEKTCN